MDHLGAERFALYGQSEGGPASILYATLHPERVTHLVLNGTFARDMFPTERKRKVREALVTIVRNEWGMGSRVLTELLLGPDALPHVVRAFTQYQRAGATPDVAARMLEANFDLDLTPILGEIQCPVLVVHARSDHAVPFEYGREIAAGVPNSELFVLEGPHQNYEPKFQAKFTGKVIQFLKGGTAPEPPALEVETNQANTAVILFVDIADSTALTERLGDARFRAASSALDERLRQAILARGGTPVEGKVMGDGVMATFTSAARAIEAARACIGVSAESELRLHVGLHAGDVIRAGANAYGGAVNIASRVCDASRAGEILVTDVLRGLARTSADVSFEDRGEHELKGVSDPVRLYGIRWRE